jgi:putative transposase
MQLLDQQYFNSFMLQETDVLAQRFSFKVNLQAIDANHQWQTIYREPKTTMSNKEHKKHPYLLKDLKISHKKIR